MALWFAIADTAPTFSFMTESPWFSPFDQEVATLFPPIGATLTRLSSISWRITFSDPVEDNPVLRATTTYRLYDDAEIAPDLAIHSVTPENVLAPTYVDLVTDEQRTGVTYRAKAFEIQVA